MHSFASRITTGTLGSDLLVSSGSVHIYGITISNRSLTIANQLRIFNAAETKQLFELAVPGDGNVTSSDNVWVMNIPFIADEGLVIKVPLIGPTSDVEVTVYHNSDGG